MNVLVTGGTGFIGSRLTAKLLARGDQVTVLTRGIASRARGPAPTRLFNWDPMAGPPAGDVLFGADAVVNLLGESIAKGRWSPAKKARILESRVVGTRNLVEGFAALPGPPRALVSASAVGYYGSRGDETLDEGSSPGSGFLPDVCKAWEAEAGRAESMGVRVVLVRTGIALSREGGALKSMLTPFRLGLGGPVGSGEQWMSWIHLDDLVGMILFAVDGAGVRGPLNGTSPGAVKNRDFGRALGRVLHRPSFVPTPAAALRLLLGEMADALLIEGQRVVPKRPQELGFRFRHPFLEPALESILTS